jgi:hypothetical protein
MGAGTGREPRGQHESSGRDPVAVAREISSRMTPVGPDLPEGVRKHDQPDQGDQSIANELDTSRVVPPPPATPALGI